MAGIIVGDREKGLNIVIRANSRGDHELVLSKHLLSEPPHTDVQKKKPIEIIVEIITNSIITTVRNCFFDTLIAIKYFHIV